VPGHSADVADHVGQLDIHPRQRLLHALNVATGTPHLDDEQRRMPMAPEAESETQRRRWVDVSRGRL
jgi:hypothetical protein